MAIGIRSPGNRMGLKSCCNPVDVATDPVDRASHDMVVAGRGVAVARLAGFARSNRLGVTG
jgi:hypothetical protein